MTIPATFSRSLLQSLPGGFAVIYNTRRPHKSLPHQATPAVACHAKPKAAPGDRSADAHQRVRTDRTDPVGKLTLRVNGKLHHVGTGHEHARTPVLMLVRDLRVRIINAATGEFVRELTIDTARDYQPLGRPPGPKQSDPKPGKRGQGQETGQGHFALDLRPSGFRSAAI